MNRKTIGVFLSALLCITGVSAKEFGVSSPDKKTKILVSAGQQVSWSVYYNDEIVLLPSILAMTLDNGLEPGKNVTILFADTMTENVTRSAILQEKRRHVAEKYTALLLTCKGGYSIEFRVFDDGVAYRFRAELKGNIKVKSETAQFNLPANAVVCYTASDKRADVDIFHTSFEGFYRTARIDTLNNSHLIFSPTLVTISDSMKLIITESDIISYPGMFLQKDAGNCLKGVFAPFPLEEKIIGGEFKQAVVTTRAAYLADTKGFRNFPWRVIGIAPTDASILTNNIVYKLVTPVVRNVKWIKPGKSTEEWITNVNLAGVDFKSGINTATYKYYVDFADSFKLNYVMLDAGWSDVNDLFKITPGMDVKEVIRYAATKKIGIILWTQASTLNRYMTAALDSFKNWGVKIVMTDFIDRDDQKANDFLHRFADEAAERELMVMIHGAPKPAGFSRTHPNALTREGVAGSEFNIWSDFVTPTHDLQLAFIRMFSGTMDYEPGLLQNTTQQHKEKMGMEKVVAQGTTMHQMAMFVIYESPLQLFSGNISDALKEPALMSFFGTIPTVWDDTKIIAAKFPEYILEVRRSNTDWFIGAMNDWTAKDFSLPTNFLKDGDYELTIAQDGINADRNAQDYKLITKTIKKGDTIDIHLAPGGGFVGRLRLVQTTR